MERGLLQTLRRISSFFDTGNLLRFIVACILAFAFWAWVEAANDPETTRTISQVPVSAVDTPPNLEVVGQLSPVEVVVQGPQSRISALETEAIQVSVDLGEVEEPGEHLIEVDVETPDGVRVRSVTPEEIQVRVDVYETRENIPVQTTTPNDVPQNLTLGQMQVEPEVVSIHGPRQMVERVEAVRVEVTIDGRSSAFSDSLVPEPIDANGAPVPDVTVDPPQVRVSVDLEVRGQVRRVVPRIVGYDALAPGYELVRAPSAVPTDEVIIEGPEDEIVQVFYLETEEIDITGWDESRVVPDVPIDTSSLPPNVTVSQDNVHVSIQIRRQAYSREVTRIPVEVVNAPDDATVTATPDVATVVLEGERTIVDSVTREDISVVVDVGASAVGTYDLAPRVILPAGVQYRQLEPETVSVTIIPNPPMNETPTPEPSLQTNGREPTPGPNT